MNVNDLKGKKFVVDYHAEFDILKNTDILDRLQKDFGKSLEQVDFTEEEIAQYCWNNIDCEWLFSESKEIKIV